MSKEKHLPFVLTNEDKVSTKEKQIEEMAVEFAKINCNPKGCYACNLCDEYGSLELNCEDYLYYRTMAETFYNAGYRKQSEGHWIDKPTGAYSRMQSWCSACGKHSGIGGIESNRHKPYCPNCGAKMKGGEQE